MCDVPVVAGATGSGPVGAAPEAVETPVDVAGALPAAGLPFVGVTTFKEADYQTLVQFLPTGIVVHDASTAILFSNAAATRLLGLTEEQMQGKSARDLAWRFLREDGTEMPREEYPVNRVLSSGEPIAQHVVGVLRPDREDPVWLLCNGYPVLDTSGLLARVVVTFIDLTQRKRAEHVLAKVQSLLGDTEELARIGAWEFFPDTQTQTWTEGTFRILEVDFTAGAPRVPEGVDFAAPEYRPMLKHAIQRAVEFGEPYDLEWEAVTAKGRRIWVRSIARVNGEPGKPRSVSGSFQDITERKKAEAALEEKLGEVERMNRLMVGRELRMVELKREINELCVQLSLPRRYSAPESVTPASTP